MSDNRARLMEMLRAAVATSDPSDELSVVKRRPPSDGGPLSLEVEALLAVGRSIDAPTSAARERVWLRLSTTGGGPSDRPRPGGAGRKRPGRKDPRAPVSQYPTPALRLAGHVVSSRPARESADREPSPVRETFYERKRAAIAAFEREYFTTLIRQCGGNISEMSRQSGMKRHHVRAFLRRHGIYWRARR